MTSRQSSRGSESSGEAAFLMPGLLPRNALAHGLVIPLGRWVRKVFATGVGGPAGPAVRRRRDDQDDVVSGAIRSLRLDGVEDSERHPVRRDPMTVV